MRSTAPRSDHRKSSCAAENQVTPFYLATKDGHRLFTWLVAPLGVYARYLNDFVCEQAGVEDVTEKLAFRLLRDDPEARLLIYFHGNAATLGQQRRTEEYRSYASGACEKVFVLAFDYRGFGKSIGEPSEAGLRNDAEAVVDWALNIAKIAPNRITLLGHSLGTAVSTAVALQYAEMGVEFAGIILCAAFTNAGNAFASYSIGGVIPVLAPIKMIPALQHWFSRKMRDAWRTDISLCLLVRKSMSGAVTCQITVDCRTAANDMIDRQMLQTATGFCACRGRRHNALESNRRALCINRKGSY